MDALNQIKEKIKENLTFYGYSEAVIESIIADIVKIDRPCVVLVKEKIAVFIPADCRKCTYKGGTYDNRKTVLYIFCYM